MALPGTPGQRISDLCNGNHITQKELAEKIGVSASQLSRIVSGETRTVSSDILIGVAKEFKVSTDYILGLSTVSVRKSYDISELGLSEGAVRGLVTGAVDVQILNRLLEHRNFPKLIDLIRIYFQDTAAKGIMARNQLIEMATASLSDLMKEHPEHRAEAKQDLQLLNAQKMGEHEAEIEKIKNVFLAILRDIKKDIAFLRIVSINGKTCRLITITSPASVKNTFSEPAAAGISCCKSPFFCMNKIQPIEAI